MHDCIRHTRRGVAGGVGVFVLLALMSVCSESTETAEDVSWSAAALTSEASDLPEGRDIVRGAIDFMQSHDQLSFEAIATYEVVQESGQKLQFDMLQRVALGRPQRLHWVKLHDGAAPGGGCVVVAAPVGAEVSSIPDEAASQTEGDVTIYQFDTVFSEEVEDEGGHTFYEVVGSPDGSDEEVET